MVWVVRSTFATSSFRYAFRTFLLLSLATLALASGCDSCPEPSCGPPVIIRLNLAAPPQSGDQVVACHLDACVTAPRPAAAAPSDDAALLFEPGPVSGSLHTRADGSLQLVVSWVDPDPEGDRYMLTVRDAAGTALASVEATATFPQADVSSGACALCYTAELGDPP